MKKIKNFLLVLLCLITFDILAQEQSIKIKTSAVCKDCKKNIESALNFAKGVKSANLDVESKEVTVIYKSDKTDPNKIRVVISKAGYDADSIPADPKAYSRLKSCCKKDGHD